MIEVSYERARRDPGRMEERMRLPSRGMAPPRVWLLLWYDLGMVLRRMRSPEVWPSVWYCLKKYGVSRAHLGVARVESNERAQTRAILGTR